MSWHIHSSASAFDSDAYGVDTDSPAHPSEIIDNELKLKDEIAIEDSIKQFIKDLAAEYFNTSEWDDEWWDAWRDKFTELM